MAPSPVKSPNQEFVEVSPRGRLRVMHVLPYQLPGRDETDLLRLQADSDVPTSDFWFNHWQVWHTREGSFWCGCRVSVHVLCIISFYDYPVDCVLYTCCD